MRTGISLSVTFADRARLRALVKDRNASQKHVWRAQIVLLTAEGVGTSAIMRDTGKSKTCVWRWQERFAEEGFEGLLRDKTRPSRIPKLDPSIAERLIALTFVTPPGETTHWTGVAMAEAAGVSVSSVHASGAPMGCNPIAFASSSFPRIPNSSASCATWSASMSIRRRTQSSSASMKRAKSRRSTAPSPGCR